MSGYEVEHGVKDENVKSSRIPRPNMETFYSELDYSQSGHGTHASPEPDHVAAPHLLLADAYNSILRSDNSRSEILAPLIEQLLDSADHPDSELKGVPDSFFADLERVDKKKLKKTDECPICGNAFLEDQYPLVVRLPCHKDHLFDLECIQPWLKLNTTCPLDRKTVWKKPAPPASAQDEDDGEYDDMYA